MRCWAKKMVMRWGLATLALLLLGTVPVFASGLDCAATATGRLADLGNRSDLRHFVRCAVQHVEEVGWEQAVQDFELDARWQDGPIYLFGMDRDGIVIFNASGAFKSGDERLGARDVDGVPHIARILYTTQVFGGGFTGYRFRNPETEDLDLKLSYVQSVDTLYQGKEAIIGAGIYPQDAPGSCHASRVRASLVYSLEDAERFVKCAELYLHRKGLRALHEFEQDPRWKSGPIYLYLVDRETMFQVVSGGAPHLDGTSLAELEDSTGYRFIPEWAREVELFGEGLAYYEFNNPATGELEPKIGYARNVRFGGFDYMLGTDIYVPSIRACNDMPPALDIDTKPELELFVRCAADLLKARGTEAFDLLLNHITWRENEAYIFIIDSECQNLVYPLDYRRDEFECDLADADGTLGLQDIVDVAHSESGEGYTSYIWLNPDSEENEVKTTFVIGMELEGETVAIGAGVYGLE